MKSKLLIIFYITAILCSLSAKADEILLKNGDRITGTIINKSGNTLEIKTEYSDKITIKWDSIESFSTTQPVLLTFSNKEEITGITEISPDNTFTVKQEGVYQSEPIPLAEITEINKKFFSGQVNAGGALFSGNTQRQSYNLNTDIVVRGRDDRVSFGGNSITPIANQEIPTVARKLYSTHVIFNYTVTMLTSLPIHGTVTRMVYSLTTACKILNCALRSVLVQVTRFSQLAISI